MESYYLEMGAHDITGELKETVVIGLEMDLTGSKQTLVSAVLSLLLPLTIREPSVHP